MHRCEALEMKRAPSRDDAMRLKRAGFGKVRHICTYARDGLAAPPVRGVHEARGTSTSFGPRGGAASATARGGGEGGRGIRGGLQHSSEGGGRGAGGGRGRGAWAVGRVAQNFRRTQNLRYIMRVIVTSSSVS